MLIGSAREIKDNENRVGMVPGGRRRPRRDGHQVLVEAGAGRGQRHHRRGVRARGRRDRADAADDVWGQADMVVKVKEPLAARVRAACAQGQILFTYLHLAPQPELTEALLETQGDRHRLRDDRATRRHAAAADADERGGGPHGGPGRRAATWRRPHGGRGVLLGGVPGRAAGRRRDPRRRRRRASTPRKMAVGLGAQRHRPRHRTSTACATSTTSSPADVETLLLEPVQHRATPCARADLVVGAVLVPGAAAPKLVTARACSRTMKQGAVIVDVAVDQGGCVETTPRRPRTRTRPTRWTASSTTAWRTCRARCRAPRTFALTNVDAALRDRDRQQRRGRAPKADPR